MVMFPFGNVRVLSPVTIWVLNETVVLLVDNWSPHVLLSRLSVHIRLLPSANIWVSPLQAASSWTVAISISCPRRCRKYSGLIVMHIRVSVHSVLTRPPVSSSLNSIIELFWMFFDEVMISAFDGKSFCEVKIMGGWPWTVATSASSGNFIVCPLANFGLVLWVVSTKFKSDFSADMPLEKSAINSLANLTCNWAIIVQNLLETMTESGNNWSKVKIPYAEKSVAGN